MPAIWPNFKSKMILMGLLLLASPAMATSETSYVSAIKQRVVEFAHNTVSTLSYSAYKLGGNRFDVSRGIYVIDCSSYVDHILKAATPNAYSSLVNSSGSNSPTSQHYYEFFKNLSFKTKQYWNKVEAVEELEPGDILVFRKKTAPRNAVRGHVMVVMEKPVVQNSGAFWVRVADSTPYRHSEDTREAHAGGIGIGKLLLKVNPETSKPYAYAWKEGAHWQRNVNFAMGRPIAI